MFADLLVIQAHKNVFFSYYITNVSSVIIFFIVLNQKRLLLLSKLVDFH